MSHMVIYRGVDGKPGYHQTDDIHDAVSFVETMRNEEGVEHARIFRLEEVIFEYRPYYRVELTNGAALTENGNGSGAQIGGGQAQVGTGSDADNESGDGDVSDDILDEAVEVVEAGDDDVDSDLDGDADADADGEKAEVGAGKKGLFGR